jgi:hypothetical protein
MNEAIYLSLAFSIQLVLFAVSIVCAFLIGRHYGIIKRTKIAEPSTLKHDADDIVDDLKATMKVTPPPRVISPSKRAATKLDDLEKDVI